MSVKWFAIFGHNSFSLKGKKLLPLVVFTADTTSETVC